MRESHPESPAAELSGGVDYLLVVPRYPRGWRNGAEFVRTRVLAYRDAGLAGLVVDYAQQPGSAPRRSVEDGVPVWSVPRDHLPAILTAAASLALPVLAHSPDPVVIDALLDQVPGHRIAAWFHGYELRDYRRLASNHPPRELASITRSRDALNAERFAAARRLFRDAESAVVFMSEFQRELAHFDVGIEALNSHVIPNRIDTDLFRGPVRRPEDATRILLMRAFTARNYGNDIALRALEELSRRPGFERLQITIRGFGPSFSDEVAALRLFGNVTVQERYSTPVEMAAAHLDHGVFLCPTRFDTQGVMLGEAMSSGMVTITNPVAAVPEFTDDTCSLLPRGDDPLAFAAAIEYLLANPHLMPSLSEAAARRVREQCGYDQTIARELDLIRERAA